MLPLVKILAVFAFIIFLLRRRYNIGLVMLAGAVVLGLAFGQEPAGLARQLGASLANSATLTLVGILALIMIMEAVMRRTGMLDDMTGALFHLPLNPRLIFVSIPAIIGLLPSAGGARFSAPLVARATADAPFRAEDRVFINYWFRHVWEFSLPLYPGLILAAHISGVPLGTIILWQWPFTITWAVLGYWFLFKLGRRGQPAPTATGGAADRDDSGGRANNPAGAATAAYSEYPRPAGTAIAPEDSAGSPGKSCGISPPGSGETAGSPEKSNGFGPAAAFAGQSSGGPEAEAIACPTIGHPDVAPGSSTAGNTRWLRTLAASTWPLWVTVLLVLGRVPMLWALGGVLAVLVARQRYSLRLVWQNLREPMTAKVVILIWGIMAFKDVLTASGAVAQVSQAVLLLGVPVLLLVVLLPLLTGVLTGLVSASIGVSFPLVMSMVEPAAVHVMMAYVAGVIGVMLSPVHLCLVLTVEYFKADFLRSYRPLVAPSLLVLAGAVGVKLLNS